MERHGSMNHIYRLIWSQVLNGWVAVAETARGRAKGSRRKLIATALALNASLAYASPSGGQLVSGAGSISQSGKTTTITQSSQNLSLNWNSFNIAPNETVNFVQPTVSAIAVNRIFDTQGTQILGHLNANGQVYLINPNGVLFGQGAQVNVGGLVASTLDLNDASLSSNQRTFSGNGIGNVINQGTITAAAGGYVALLGNHVSNQGVIVAQLGSVALGAGSAATLTFSGNSLVSMRVDQSVLNSLAENGGLIRADGGLVVMSAGAKDALLTSVVNNTGVIEARTVENHAGTITLLGGMTAGTVNVDGTLDASAPDGGNGGFIETSAASINVGNDAKVTTAAAMGLAGTWLIDPVDFTIAASGGDMTGAVLGTSLASGNVTIKSISGASGTSGNVNVNDVVTWSANQLTLNAQNNININANLNGSGTASLALQYGQGAIATGNASYYSLNSGAQVNLPAGQNFSTLLGSTGVTTNYSVITSLGAPGSTTTNDLQGMQGALGGNYVLGSNIDASATGTLAWTSAGFTPIGNQNTPFTGIFDGLGHTISNLTINLPSTDYVGLFGATGLGSVIQNVGLVGESVTGSSQVGGLVGYNQSAVSNSYTTGSVTGSNYNSNPVGGLIGANDGGTVRNSYTTSSVSGSYEVGGLVGYNNNNGTVSNSYATGSVTGLYDVGGLVGLNNYGTIGNSYATGSVTVNNSAYVSSYIGGLVGFNNNAGTVSNSYATGSVTASYSSYVGGLIGANNGTVSSSFWDSGVNTTGISGGTMTGATGLSSTQMQQQSNFGGWDFANTWIVYNGFTNPLLRSFMTPLTVTANNAIKIYDGQNYAGGNGVTYSSVPNGNLLGAASYSGATNAGSYTITPGGLYSSQQGYLLSYGSGVLTVTPALLTVTANNASKIYGAANPTLNVSYSGFVNGDTAASLTTAAIASTTATTGSNAGRYVISAAGAVNGNYTYTYVNGTLTVVPPTLPSATLEALLPFSQTNMRLAMLNLSPTITVTQCCSADTAVGDKVSSSNTSSPASEEGAVANSTMTISAKGPALQIVNGGITLPDNLLNVNE